MLVHHVHFFPDQTTQTSKDVIWAVSHPMNLLISQELADSLYQTIQQSDSVSRRYTVESEVSSSEDRPDVQTHCIAHVPAMQRPLVRSALLSEVNRQLVFADNPQIVDPKFLFAFAMQGGLSSGSTMGESDRVIDLERCEALYKEMASGWQAIGMMRDYFKHHPVRHRLTNTEQFVYAPVLTQVRYFDNLLYLRADLKERLVLPQDSFDSFQV